VRKAEGPVSEQPGSPISIELSVRLYRWLLAVYPAQFRAEYERPMAQVFRDFCRRDYQRRGILGLTSLWARTSLDLLRSTVEEHLEKGLEMTRDNFVRWSAWALMAGAGLFAAGLILGSFDSDGSDPIGGVDALFEITQIAGISLGQFLLVIGLSGLRIGYGPRSGTLGRALLLAAIFGGLISLAGILLMGSSDAGWSLWAGGLVGMTLALSAFGGVAIRRRIFTRWNFVPLLAGVMVPALFGLSVAMEAGGISLGDWIFPLGVSATGIGLGLLGYRIQADAGIVPQGAAA